MEPALSRNLVKNFQSISKAVTTPIQTHRIKVLHLITSLEIGGTQHGLLLGLPKFDNKRYEHIVCSLMDRMQMKEQFQESGIEVHSLALDKKTDIAVALRLRSLLKELRPDILHTYLLHGNVIGRIIGRLVGTPIIIGSERTIGQAKVFGRLLTKLTNPLTDVVEVNSFLGAKAIAKDLGVPKRKIEVVQSGLDLDNYPAKSKRIKVRSSLGLSHEQHLILIIGRLRHVKGVDQGLIGFEKILNKHASAHLAIAGEGEQLVSLQSLVKELGISKNVTFLGARNDLPALLSASDSVLIPSRNEGFPRVAIEAMAAGKPVVATTAGGIPEAIIDGETGILVPPNDVNAMAIALSSLIENKTLRNHLGQVGEQRARQNYSIEKYVTRLDNLYQTLLKTHEKKHKINYSQNTGI